MQVAIALVTCDRAQFGQPNYFDATWGSLARAGLFEQIENGDAFSIFDAGPGRARAEYLQAAYAVQAFGGPDHMRLDVVRNMHRAFAWMAGTGCEFGMLLPDDLLMCRNTLARAKAWVDGRDGKYVSLYSLSSQYNWTMAPANVARGWAPYAVADFYGGLGAIVPREVLVGYLLSDFRQVVERRTSGVDMALHHYLESVDATLLAHCPNLIRHVGMGSTLGHKHREDDHYFPGESFDALSGDYGGGEEAGKA